MRAQPWSIPAVVVLGTLVLIGLSACANPTTTPDTSKPESPPPSAPGSPLESDDIRTPESALVSSAAGNTPRAGSVTQGSRATAGVTADVVSWTPGGVSIAGLPPLTTSSVDSVSGLTYYTNGEQSGLAAVVTHISRGSEGPAQAYFRDGDPVVIGLWMYRTGDGFEWGTFADALAASDGRAVDGTYGGTSVGVYTDADSGVEFFTARVTVTVSGSSVTGRIDQILDISGAPVMVPGAGAYVARPDIVLGSAATSADLATGNTALRVGGTPVPGVNGKWGVTFFTGDHAAGTWGVTAGTRFSVVGTFRATR